jgi:hypothetical protein
MRFSICDVSAVVDCACEARHAGDVIATAAPSSTTGMYIRRERAAARTAAGADGIRRLTGRGGQRIRLHRDDAQTNIAADTQRVSAAIRVPSVESDRAFDQCRATGSRRTTDVGFPSRSSIAR